MLPCHCKNDGVQSYITVNLYTLQGPYHSQSNMCTYYYYTLTLQWIKFNYMTELSATILELIYENNKDSVT